MGLHHVCVDHNASCLIFKYRYSSFRPLELFTIVFNLAFIGKNFFESVVRNKKIDVGKDAGYNFLNSSTYNWIRFTILLSRRIYFIIKSFLNDSSEEALIFDDST